MSNKAEGETLEDYLDNKVFGDNPGTSIDPDPTDAEGFNEFIKRYKKAVAVEKAAAQALK